MALALNFCLCQRLVAFVRNELKKKAEIDDALCFIKVAIRREQ